MVNCNKCKNDFEIKVRTRYVIDDIEEVFFNCPHCHERYTSYYLNDNIKDMQKKIRKFRGNKYKENILKKKIEKEMNRLEELVGTL